MFVQRLQRWLRRIAASLFHPHAHDVLPPERTAVLSASLRGETGASGVSSGASWLDDGRRLRPRPSPPAKLDQRWNARLIPPRQPVPTQPQASRAPTIRPAAEQPKAETPRKKPAEPAQSGELIHPVSGSPSPAMDGQIEYRRLMALKRLVRLGIYNEGFDPSRVPEQYLQSLGREDDLGAE